MAKFIAFIFISLFMSIAYPAFSQPGQDLNIFGYKFLDYRDNVIPEKLLSTRSAVFVAVPNKPNGSRGEWITLAQKAHDYFKRLNIDAIAYFYVQDVFSGQESQQAFFNWIAKRKVENLIHLSETELNGVKGYRLIIAPFNGQSDIMPAGQKAWKTENVELERLFVNLNRTVGGANLRRENFLIVDKPEFFADVPLFAGKRFEDYQQDLKLDKLAVPLFAKLPFPDQYPPDPLNERLARAVKEYNVQVDLFNEQLHEMMHAYPFEYGFVDLSQKKPDQLRNEGYQFILYYINTSGLTAKLLLDYKVQETETDFISLTAGLQGVSIKALPVDYPVFKFYIKHIYTADVFLGTKWDADEDWGNALRNHLTGMRSELKIR